MEVSRVLQSYRVVQDYCKQDYQNEQPNRVDPVLVGRHEILPQIHGLEIEES